MVSREHGGRVVHDPYRRTVVVIRGAGADFPRAIAPHAPEGPVGLDEHGVTLARAHRVHAVHDLHGAEAVFRRAVAKLTVKIEARAPEAAVRHKDHGMQIARGYLLYPGSRRDLRRRGRAAGQGRCENQGRGAGKGREGNRKGRGGFPGGAARGPGICSREWVEFHGSSISFLYFFKWASRTANGGLPRGTRRGPGIYVEGLYCTGSSETTISGYGFCMRRRLIQKYKPGNAGLGAPVG